MCMCVTDLDDTERIEDNIDNIYNEQCDKN